MDNKIPDQRKLQLMQSLAEHFNCTLDQVTMELIVEASEMDTRLEILMKLSGYIFK